jgi:DNA-binding FadR family transcriptional regulator
MFVVPNRANMVIEEHRHIIEAIDQGDAELAGQRMQEHIEFGARMLTQYLEDGE